MIDRKTDGTSLVEEPELEAAAKPLEGNQGNLHETKGGMKNGLSWEMCCLLRWYGRCPLVHEELDEAK